MKLIYRLLIAVSLLVIITCVIAVFLVSDWDDRVSLIFAGISWLAVLVISAANLVLIHVTKKPNEPVDNLVTRASPHLDGFVKAVRNIDKKP